MGGKRKGRREGGHPFHGWAIKLVCVCGGGGGGIACRRFCMKRWGRKAPWPTTGMAHTLGRQANKTQC